MTEKIKHMIARFGTERVKQIAFMASVLLATLIVLGFSVNKITVNDGKSVQTIYSLKSSPTDILRLASLTSDNYRIVNVTEKGNNIDISLKYTFPVFVTAGKDTKEVCILKGQTVAEAITAAGITLDEHDTVNLPLDSAIDETVYIDIVDINYVTSTVSERIPYTSKTVYSNKTTGKTVTTKGSEGEKEITMLTKYVNGKAISTETLSEKVVKEAVNEVITIGTKKPAVTTSESVSTISQLKPSKPIELDKNGNPVNYKKHITVQATAYYQPGTKGASGMDLKPGCVAINTNLYPYGTKFYIKSSDGAYIYGYAVAADTGGFVKTRPTNFDLFFTSIDACRRFGRRNIEVYVLD